MSKIKTAWQMQRQAERYNNSHYGRSRRVVMAFAHNRSVPADIYKSVTSQPKQEIKMSGSTELKEILRVLTEIHAAVTADAAPNYRRPLADYGRFHWPSIGATEHQRDSHGVSSVEFAGRMWTRRSGGGKFGKAIWFSRATGKDDDGNNQYLRLITFRDLEPAEAIPFELPAPPARLRDLVGKSSDTATKKVATTATNGDARATIATGTAVTVQGRTASKNGVMKHYSAEYCSVQIGKQMLTVRTDRISLPIAESG